VSIVNEAPGFLTSLAIQYCDVVKLHGQILILLNPQINPLGIFFCKVQMEQICAFYEGARIQIKFKYFFSKMQYLF
jgi:hypothetical protein